MGNFYCYHCGNKETTAPLRCCNTLYKESPPHESMTAPFLRGECGLCFKEFIGELHFNVICSNCARTTTVISENFKIDVVPPKELVRTGSLIKSILEDYGHPTVPSDTFFKIWGVDPSDLGYVLTFERLDSGSLFTYFFRNTIFVDLLGSNSMLVGMSVFRDLHSVESTNAFVNYFRILLEDVKKYPNFHKLQFVTTELEEDRASFSMLRGLDDRA